MSVRNFAIALFLVVAAWPLSEVIGNAVENYQFKEFEYQECEYLVVDYKWGRISGVAHKGNCKNPIHLREKN